MTASVGGYGVVNGLKHFEFYLSCCVIYYSKYSLYLNTLINYFAVSIAVYGYPILKQTHGALLASNQRVPALAGRFNVSNLAVRNDARRSRQQAQKIGQQENFVGGIKYTRANEDLPTEDGVDREETVEFKMIGDEMVRVVSGSYSYQSPEGLAVSFKYDFIKIILKISHLFLFETIGSKLSFIINIFRSIDTWPMKTEIKRVSQLVEVVRPMVKDLVMQEVARLMIRCICRQKMAKRPRVVVETCICLHHKTKKKKFIPAPFLSFKM